MESRFIDQSKQDYSKMLLANGSLERSKEVAELDAYEPIFKFRAAHDQAEPSAKDLNEMINESYVDINALILGFREAGKSFHNLMIATDAKLKAIKQQLLIEKEKLDDLNILCNQYTDFNSVINLDNTNLYGSYSYNNGMISSKAQSQEAIKYTIASVDGNGYEGNAYVYKSNAFLKNSIDTSRRDFIKDDNDLTVYEYSRITANNSEKDVFQYVNFDSIEAKATLSLTSTNEFNKIVIHVSSKDTFLTGLLISSDGISYKNVLANPIEVNNESLKYDSVNYIATSGMLCFPSTKYLKLVFESNGVTDDIIAFEKVSVIDPASAEKKTVTYTTTTINKIETSTVTTFGVKDPVVKTTGIGDTYIPSNEKYVYDSTRKKIMLQVLQ